MSDDFGSAAQTGGWLKTLRFPLAFTHSYKTAAASPALTQQREGKWEGGKGYADVREANL